MKSRVKRAHRSAKPPKSNKFIELFWSFQSYCTAFNSKCSSPNCHEIRCSKLHFLITLKKEKKGILTSIIPWQLGKLDNLYIYLKQPTFHLYLHTICTQTVFYKLSHKTATCARYFVTVVLLPLYKILPIKPLKIIFLMHRLNTTTDGSDRQRETKCM